MLYTSFDLDARRIIGLRRLVAEPCVVRGRRFGTDGDPEQRLVALRVTVDRRDHYQHVRRARRTVVVHRHCGRRRRQVLVQVSRRSVHRFPEIGSADHRVQRDRRVPDTGLQVPGHPISPLARVVPAQGLAERAPVLHRHQIVQYRIDRRREVIEATGDRVQQLVHLGVVRRVFGVQIEQSLRVERSPAQEERYDDSS